MHRRPALSRFVVADTSMQPTLLPGDRLLVSGWPTVRPGHVVVLADPEQPARYLAKRVTDVAPDGSVFVRGENANVSRDSRVFGGVPRALVVGRVVWRYLPARRRGRV